MTGTTGLEIAVIGMACRFPGAASIEAFWGNVKSGVESIIFFTDRELEEAGVESGLLAHPNYVKARGFLEGAEYFDAEFFSYTPAEARLMDPQMRIYFECAWAGFEDAGYNPGAFPGLIGVYSGASPNIKWVTHALSRAKSPSQEFEIFNLNSNFMFGTRIAYNFNLKGPAITLATGCSSSLVAIHLACQGLLNAECDMALAGGVSINAEGKAGYLYQEGMIGSPDGHCRAFDAHARGTVEGEGAGIVVLKRLEEALEDGDHIYAVIKGSAVNNDGSRKIGYNAPSVEGQSEVIKAALEIAGVDSESISYVEAHGTATHLGDPIEIEGLKTAFNTDKKQFCAIGSVKTNIGHLDAAAGIAGFIKTVLALKNRLIPPSLHFQTPNPQIDFEHSPFYVNTQPREWKNETGPPRAGVSSFGIGGTNAHVVLEAWPEIEKSREGREEREEREERDFHLILLSAKTGTALDKMTENLAEYLKKNPGLNLADAAYTLQVGRRAFRHRRMVVSSSAAEIVQAFTHPGDPNDLRVKTFSAAGENQEPPVIFMFPGLGSQYVGMGLELYKTIPIFREEMDRCFVILQPLTGYDFKEILYPSFENNTPNKSYGANIIDQAEVAQPIIFIFEYALVKLLTAWGVAPQAMIGYSFGEYAAACAAGVFSLEDALRLVVSRGKLIQKAPVGAMLSVPLPRQEVAPLLAGETNREHELSMAIDNGPSCIVAGSPAAVDAFERKLKEKKLLCMRAPASRALHTPMMAGIAGEFREAAASLRLNIPQIPYISNVTGNWIQGNQAVDPAYWATHLQQTVQFGDGIKLLVNKWQDAIFIEVGPGSDLSALVVRYIDQNPEQRILHLVRRPQRKVADDYFLLDKIGRLWLYGIKPDWQAFYAGEKKQRIPLPGYPFDRNYYPAQADPFAMGMKILSPQPLREQDKPAPGAVAASVHRRSHLSDAYEAPRDQIENTLAEIWQRLFGFDRIGIRDDFFELGGDSLKGLTVIAEIRKTFNAELTLSHLFTTSTIQGLAETVKNAGEAKYYSLEPAEKREYYPISSAQERLYFLQQLRPESVFYNTVVIMEIEGKLDHTQVEIFENAFKTLIRRHESLRTAFFVVDGEPVQVIRRPGDVDFCIQYRELPGGDPGIISDGFIRPFDLARAPLMRLEIVKTGADKYLWLFDIHHIICDASAYAVLIKELVRLYNGEELPPLRVQYRDFSQWQNQLPGSGRIAGQSGYWLKTFSDGVPALNFPTDYPRPKSLEFKGSFLEFHLPEEEALRFLEINASEGVTLFMSLLAVLNILLSRYTGKSDIVIGSTSAGRPHHDLREMIGMFVNMLPLRNFPRPHMSFREFLQEVKTSTLQVFENQDVQFEMLVKLLNLEITASRNPLFDICINVENYEHPALEAPGLLFKFYQHRYRNAKFDMLLWAKRLEKGIQFMLEYSTELFKFSTAEAFLNHFIEIIRQVIENKDTRLNDIHISQRLLIPESHVPEIDFEL
ncbi:MAG: condensation domain-containing protein [Candidatus Aminicenantes bacterium]|nr:condensation domain-containing protein [Candidatus Aminicenantes bacterium]